MNDFQEQASKKLAQIDLLETEQLDRPRKTFLVQKRYQVTNSTFDTDIQLMLEFAEPHRLFLKKLPPDMMQSVLLDMFLQLQAAVTTAFQDFEHKESTN